MHAAIDLSPPRELLKHLYRVAIDAVHGGRTLVARSHVDADIWRFEGGDDALTVPLPEAASNGRVVVVGAGKAASAMARGMEAVLQERISDGIVVVKYGHHEPLRYIRAFEAGHPVPDAAGVAATHQLLRLLQTASAEDTVFCVLSGGASSLLVAPAPGVSLDDKAMTTRMLLNSGASIQEANLVRKHISAVKGGRLRPAQCRAFCTLAISDVVGDDPATIGSGPTVPDASSCEDALHVIDRYGLRSTLPPSVMTHLICGCGRRDPVAPFQRSSVFRIVANIRQAIEACVAEAVRIGLGVRVLSDQMNGNTHDAARSFAAAACEAARAVRAGAAPILLLAAGETTLAVRGTGRGGRNQEFALAAAQTLQGVRHVTLLSTGTDGTDGPTDAAGAFVDESTFARARALGLEPMAHLRNNDSHPLFDTLGDLHNTGPTGTNVMDLVMALIH
jgi:hydroxypyruvate reductase